MNKILTKDNFKIILKLIIVIPLFYYLGIKTGSDLIAGDYISMLLLIIVCPIAGFVLYKI